jgi:hypothetical protein
MKFNLQPQPAPLPQTRLEPGKYVLPLTIYYDTKNAMAELEVIVRSFGLYSLICIKYKDDPDMAQEVRCRPLTLETLLRAWGSPCGICGEQSGTGMGFSPNLFGLPCSYHSTVVLHTHTSSGG